MLKQLLQWHKPEKEVIYIPVFGDGVPYLKKWSEDGYLKAVEAMSINNVWLTEIIEAVTQIRNKADTANTPDMLKAYNEAIKIVKDLLVKPEIAKMVRRELDVSRNNEFSDSSLK